MRKIALVVLVSLMFVISLKFTVTAAPSQWAVDEVDLANEYNLVTEKVMYDFQNNINREEFAELAVRLYEALSGVKAQPEESNPFYDTNNTEILKANKLEIIQGKGGGRFAPHDTITREELATMFYRTIRAVDPFLVVGDYQLTFSDANQISSWAVQPVAFMNAQGILGGVGNNRVAPKGTATREEAIALVLRTYQKFDSQYVNQQPTPKPAPIPDPAPAPTPTDDKDTIFGIVIGSTEQEVVSTLGQAARKEPSAYGYEWWVYNQDLHNFVMVGVQNGKVVTIYSNSQNWEYHGVRVGTSSAVARQKLPLLSEVVIEKGNTTFRVTQSNDNPMESWLAISPDDPDVVVRPILDIHDNNKVTAIQLFSGDVILAQGNYMIIRSFPGGQTAHDHRVPKLTDAQQRAVDRANELQLLDLVNSIRIRHGLQPLLWEQRVADIALLHSIDMRENNFFAHISPNSGTLGDRFKAGNIDFRLILENIASRQEDAIQVNEGLMNSWGHRVNILNDEVTHLGTGAYYKHYTQKFLKK